MTGRVSYILEWFHGTACVVNFSEEQARARYAAGEPFAAILDCEEGERAVLRFYGAHVSVGFIDREAREYLTYDFVPIHAKRLFLRRIVDRTFVEGSAELAGAVAYNFEERGWVKVVRRFYNPAYQESGSSEADVSQNYEDRPTFGDYQSLIRQNRDMKVKASTLH